MIRTAILSVRDAARLDSADEAVAALRDVLSSGPYTEIDYQEIPDEQAMVRAKLRLWADDSTADLILTIGGIGAAVRHRTPDATLQVVDKQFPGIPEVLRAAGAQVDPAAGLWRAVAGVRRSALIVNLPGEPRNLHVGLTAISALLVSATSLIAD